MSSLMRSQRVSMAAFQKTALLDAGSSAYLEMLYEDYLEGRADLPPDWNHYFEQLASSSDSMSEARHLHIQEEFRQLAKHPVSSPGLDQQVVQEALEHERKQVRVRECIDAFRLLGHLHADINPLRKPDRQLVAELMPSFYQFSEHDLATNFDVGSLPGSQQRPLRQIIHDLNKIYCETLASEFMHIPDSPERIWVQERVEEMCMRKTLESEEKIHLLDRLIDAEGLENYLGTRYPGAKRFSLEGCDSLLVALDTLIQEGSKKGAREVIIGMAHRGRLNVLVNLLGKQPKQLFDEFEGKILDEKLEMGDVKYHLGFSSNLTTNHGRVHLSLSFNPSHLEVVTPVVCGSVRARQERRNDTEYTQVLPIAVHGDASFSGQGIVMETLNMSETRGFRVGGTVHIIVNNQVGFTTSNPQDARSTLYSSDIGKMIEAPIFHVNANDPEAVYKAMLLALEYRKEFKKDIIIDLIGYRKHGHNEADEPSVTQPAMYKIIRSMPTPATVYAERLIGESVITIETVEKMRKDYRDAIVELQRSVVDNLDDNRERDFSGDWKPYAGKKWRAPTDTSVPLSTLQALALKQCELPEGFPVHRLVKKVLDDRRKMTQGEQPLDWGYAENLAYATLLVEHCPIRLSGQDVGRGTFFHRHAVLYHQENESEYVPLSHLSEDQAKFSPINSLLSEEAVLAFEYGFAKTEPKGLVIWEAQFGDFANGAQVVIDQFISSGEQKWGMLCGVVLFLPHGYEGQGAEHSSARLERYLQLCAKDNIQVCVPTTPAQVFHMLRRQFLRPLRIPLVVMTPKSLLRHKLAVSQLEDLASGQFLPVIDEMDDLDPASLRRVVLCSGKIYYDLLQNRRESNSQDVAIVRIEQLYPFPDEELKSVLTKYAAVKDIVWCQEEPKNQGAWYMCRDHFESCLSEGQTLRYAGRRAAPAPAVGYFHLYQEQQKAVIQEALE